MGYYSKDWNYCQGDAGDAMYFLCEKEEKRHKGEIKIGFLRMKRSCERISQWRRPEPTGYRLGFSALRAAKKRFAPRSVRIK